MAFTALSVFTGSYGSSQKLGVADPEAQVTERVPKCRIGKDATENAQETSANRLSASHPEEPSVIRKPATEILHVHVFKSEDLKCHSLLLKLWLGGKA